MQTFTTAIKTVKNNKTMDPNETKMLVGDGGLAVVNNLPPPASEQHKKDEDDEVKGGEEHEDEEEELSYDPGATPLGCGIFGKYPITALLGFVVLGLIVGIGLSSWRPEVRAPTVHSNTHQKDRRLSVCFHVFAVSPCNCFGCI